MTGVQTRPLWDFHNEREKWMYLGSGKKKLSKYKLVTNNCDFYAFISYECQLRQCTAEKSTELIYEKKNITYFQLIKCDSVLIFRFWTIGCQ